MRAAAVCFRRVRAMGSPRWREGGGRGERRRPACPNALSHFRYRKVRLVITDQQREHHTPPMLMWNQSLSFLKSAAYVDAGPQRERGLFDSPAQFLACHGLELALKSYLRAKGYGLRKLRRKVSHSLIEALDRCISKGLDKPPQDVAHILEFADEAHTLHEF